MNPHPTREAPDLAARLGRRRYSAAKDLGGLDGSDDLLLPQPAPDAQAGEGALSVCSLGEPAGAGVPRRERVPPRV